MVELKKMVNSDELIQVLLSVKTAITQLQSVS